MGKSTAQTKLGFMRFTNNIGRSNVLNLRMEVKDEHKVKGELPKSYIDGKE
jgi:hypothetical protein